MTAVTNPASNLKLASGIFPMKRFVDEGINVGIGTDDTLFALIDGRVKFEHKTKTKKQVSVYAD